MKRVIPVLFICIVLLLCLPLQAFAAIVFDGNVLPAEWFDYPPAKVLSWDPSWCGITNATIQFAVQPAQNRVMFGISAVAPGVDADSAIGAAFLVNGREIGRWQRGLDVSFDSVNYDLRGLSYVPENSSNGGYTFEIALGYKTEAALLALRDLSIRLFGPLGVSSQEVPCPIVTAEPVTTTKAPTTEKTTTTKAPTTEKTTTTKAPTTEKPTTTKAPTTEKTTTTKEPTTEKTTTTKAPTTEKPTTTLPVYTTAPQVFSYTPPLTTAYRAPTTQKVTTATPAAAQKAQTTQPGTSRTEVFYYTVVYTDAPNTPIAPSQPGVPDMASFDLENLWTDANCPTEVSQPQSVPTLALPAPQTTRTASPGTALLLSVGGVLALLAAGLIVFWLHTQKKPTEEPPAEPPDCQP